jgi:hypothetical protein
MGIILAVIGLMTHCGGGLSSVGIPVLTYIPINISPEAGRAGSTITLDVTFSGLPYRESYLTDYDFGTMIALVSFHSKGCDEVDWEKDPLFDFSEDASSSMDDSDMFSSKDDAVEIFVDTSSSDDGVLGNPDMAGGDTHEYSYKLCLVVSIDQKATPEVRSFSLEIRNGTLSEDFTTIVGQTPFVILEALSE